MSDTTPTPARLGPRGALRLTAVAAAGLVLGLVIGAAASSSPPPQEATPVAAPTPVETRVIDREVIPTSCLLALDAADAAFDVSSRAFGVTGALFDLSSQSLTAIVAADWTLADDLTGQMEAKRAELDALHAELDVEGYKGPRDACRDAA